ncbi:hypothetical protein, partial [Niallia circulans]
MNTSKLEVGKTYKNYKELCLSMGEKVKTSKSKLKHIDDMSKYFITKRWGDNFIVLHIYDKPLELNNKEEWMNKLISYLEVKHFKYSSESTIFLRGDSIIKEIKFLLNEHINNKIQAINKVVEVSTKNIEIYYNLDDSGILEYIDIALRKLRGQCKLYYDRYDIINQRFKVLVNSSHYKREIIKDDINKLKLENYLIEGNSVIQGIYAIVN